MSEKTNDNGQTFKEWLAEVDGVYAGTIGLGMDDLGDAPWWDYWNDGLPAEEAVECALTDWQDAPDDLVAMLF